MATTKEEKRKLKTISIRGKLYVTVSERILYFTEQFPNGSIETKILSQLTDDHVFVEAIVVPDIAIPTRKFNAFSQGKPSDSPVNKTACLENVCTSAIGRALSLLGIGILDSVASADEMAKAGVARASDAPKGPTKPYALRDTANGYQVPIDDKCAKCGSPMAISKSTGKPYCKSLCWKNPQTPKEEGLVSDTMPF